MLGKMIEKIELVFENLEYIIIPFSFFKKFCVCSAQDDFSHVEVNMVLSGETENCAHSFEGDVFSIHYCGKKLFERLKRCDITHISVCFSGGSKRCYTVVWEDKEKDEYTNRLQCVLENEQNDLEVYVGHVQKNAKRKNKVDLC